MRTFDETDLPILPPWFCNLILSRFRKESRTTKANDRSNPSATSSYSYTKECDISETVTKDVFKFEPASLSEQETYRFRTSRNYKPLWNKQSLDLKDRSNSSYEYHIAKMGFHVGLNPYQVMTVIRDWWRHHQIEGKIDRLVRYTLLNAWEASKEYVKNYQAVQAAKTQEKFDGKTVNRILGYLLDNESASLSELEKELGLKHSTAQMALKRMCAKGNVIEKIGRGRYRVMVVDETDLLYTA